MKAHSCLKGFNIIIFSASVIILGTDLYHYIRFFHYYTWCLYYNIKCFDHYTRCIYHYIRCFYLARARVGPQDKQVITHNGPPTILTVAPMTRRFTKISGPPNQSAPQVFAPPPAVAPSRRPWVLSWYRVYLFVVGIYSIFLNSTLSFINLIKNFQFFLQ